MMKHNKFLLSWIQRAAPKMWSKPSGQQERESSSSTTAT